MGMEPEGEVAPGVEGRWASGWVGRGGGGARKRMKPAEARDKREIRSKPSAKMTEIKMQRAQSKVSPRMNFFPLFKIFIYLF